MAIINVGNLIVCPFVGLMMDALGRKKTLWMSNLLALIGVTIEASAQNSKEIRKFKEPSLS